MIGCCSCCDYVVIVIVIVVTCRCYVGSNCGDLLGPRKLMMVVCMYMAE